MHLSTGPLDTLGPTSSPDDGSLSHEVGFVSLSTGTEPKYIGPSSGYFFTKLLSAPTQSYHVATEDSTTNRNSLWYQNDRLPTVQAFQEISVDLPATEHSVRQLSRAFFGSIHVQYPFLHQPSHDRHIMSVYQSSEPSSIALFQVTMVLSISALIRSRHCRVELPSAAWCATAMSRFADLNFENSTEGLQCLLLLLIYTMHNPSSNFNAWHLSYLCIAMVLDLGLQRNASHATTLSPFQKEMRKRIFWVVYSLDRRLSTMMGRPIGLRDEACDVRVSLDPTLHSPKGQY